MSEDELFKEPFPKTDEEFQQWFFNVQKLMALQKGLAEGEEDERFKGGHLSCARWRFGLYLNKDQFKGLNLSWFWYADGPVLDPMEVERYTKGLIKWVWNENGECEQCLNRDMCYDVREAP